MHFRKLFFGRFLPLGGYVAMAWTLAQMTVVIIQAIRALGRDKPRLRRLLRTLRTAALATVLVVELGAGVWGLHHRLLVLDAGTAGGQFLRHFLHELAAAPWPYWLLPVLGLVFGVRRRRPTAMP